MSTVPLILASVLLVVLGQTLVKLGINSVSGLDISNGLASFYLRILLRPYVLGGAFLYGFATLLWLYVLSKVDLSYAYPFLALTYVLVIISAWLFLGEPIPVLRWIGLSVICIGVLIIARTY
jgi:drug/metabolite transporter (DMT)-like permease